MKTPTFSFHLMSVLGLAGLLAACEASGPMPAATTTAQLADATTATCGAQGWASQNGGTTGGGTATPTVVATYAQLKAALENSSVKVVQVNGTITIPSGGRISLQDQTGKTLFGSAGARLVSADQSQNNSGILYVKRCRNILLRNLVFEGPGAYDTDGWDNCTLDASTNVWVDHCEFRDGVDGNFDIKNASDYITVSWTKFAYLKAPRAGGSGGSDDHRFSNLIGSSDGATGDRGKLRITFARCWWAPGCVARMPRVRFGKVHVVNSLFNSPASKSGVQAGFEADIRIQANVFESVTNPIDLMDQKSTAVQEISNLFTSVSGAKVGNGKTAFTPPYTVSVLAASSVKSAVTASNGAGATVGGNVCTNSGI
ncbi:pectate lyase family protein [Hymenobacter metallilatus]|uniref:Pectate lyase n=1 Tax=Hymenobacter metallilatus TaxID=2493666 RepID=A0A3R9PFA1_9BACT|nr:pectate lyase [Hymenobacter metallilatus]RSK36243.1 pectate lyase [Hymenobacter metallilatus]